MSYLHANGVVHRDLKAENVVFHAIDLDFSVKIIDFGVSTKISVAEKLQKIVGTLYYMAPEVLEGRYDSACDIWSLGVILFLLLGGEPPFWG